jgi:magnesium transporter
MVPAAEYAKPWETIEILILGDRAADLVEFLDQLSPSETARAISRLTPELQARLLKLLSPEEAAEVIEDIIEVQAAEMIEELPPDEAAAILEELDSDHVVDLLGEMDQENVTAIIDQMKPEDAREARQFLKYPEDTAGGIMISEVLSYPAELTIRELLVDLRKNREKYVDFHVQYLYVTDRRQRLLGVLRLHDLLFPEQGKTLRQVMVKNPLKIVVSATIEDLRNFFAEHDLYGVPVVDHDDCLLGLVLPEAVEEARRKRSVTTYLRLSGIVGGEEFRSMPLLQRSGRRLSWLSLNIVLNILAASVIALFQETLAAAIVLAVFLPMVSDMSGCSGNQAVAVSMRELTLGLVRPHELLRVLGKELSLGLINGLVLGLLIGVVALLWQGNPYLGLVLGAALAANTLVAVGLGGLLPLLLKRLSLDPALVSGPLLTTVTDMCGFFFVLSFASLLLPRLS